MVFDHRGVAPQDRSGDLSPGVFRAHLVLAVAACARFLVPLLPLTTIFLVRGSSQVIRSLPERR